LNPNVLKRRTHNGNAIGIIVETGNLDLVLKVLRITGIVMLSVSGITFLLGAIGLISFEMLAIGASTGIRSIASIAVLGCLLAAVGHCDEFKRD
jgi:hypothetical protein